MLPLSRQVTFMENGGDSSKDQSAA